MKLSNVSSVANDCISRMGQPPLYPFVLVPKVIDKLRFVHDLIRRSRG
jgi:hypothetical protein